MLPCANQLQQRCHHHQHRPLQQQLTPTHSSHHAAARRAHTAARAQTTTSTTAAPLDQQAVAAAIPQPPPDYEYKSDILPETLEVVQQQYPQLLGLVQAGNLVVYRRPASYRERRTDGYQEPALIFILGTAHVSDQSAADVSQLIQAVQPDAVVVELCKSRTGVLNTGEDEGEPQQQQQQQQKEARLQEHQARWQQQWQQWQQRKDPGGAAAAAASSSSATNSAEEEQDTSPHQTLATTDTAAVTSSSSSNSSSASQAPSGGVWQQLRSSLTASRASKASNPLSLAGADPVSALARSAALGGQQAMLLRLLIAGQARKAADQLGVQPGAEFRAAAAAAAAVPGGGCCLVLGDRPIEITLSRAWEALSWRRRLQLLGDLMTAGLAASDKAVLSQAQVESLRSDDAISGLFKSLSDRYPELVAPLITERDLYLSWSLKRSKAVNGTRVVVGCVGKGHLRGIVYALKHDNGNLRFKDLVGGKNNRQNRRAAAAAAARRLVLELVLGAAAYAAWVAATAGPAGQ